MLIGAGKKGGAAKNAENAKKPRRSCPSLRSLRSLRQNSEETPNSSRRIGLGFRFQIIPTCSGGKPWSGKRASHVQWGARALLRKRQLQTHAGRKIPPVQSSSSRFRCPIPENEPANSVDQGVSNAFVPDNFLGRANRRLGVNQRCFATLARPTL